MTSKVHSQGNVPFSWENKPGVSKEVAADQQDGHHHVPPSELPSPPCQLDNTRISLHHHLQIPLKHTVPARRDNQHLPLPSKLPLPPCPPHNRKIFQIPLSQAARGRQDHHHFAPPEKLPPPPCPPNNSRDFQIPSQAATGQQDHHHFALPAKLPPPPCPPENSRVSFHDLQIPLPPCAFQPPSRSSSRKGLKKIDDPFLIAYKEVTKSTRKGDQALGFMKNMSIFSCKRSSCSVAEDNVIRLSQLPLSRSRRDGDYNN